ncbi:MAG: divalent metal cation transporter [Thermomicrobia bacterium]|nr:divalent metal cation transporter [Thermomicrobia bacterium]
MTISRRPPALPDDEKEPVETTKRGPALEPPITEGSFADSIPDPDHRLGDRRIDVQPKGIRKFLNVLDPGLITGASDDDRIGLVSGKGLAATIKQYYPKGVLYPIVILLIFANTFNVGADLAAIAAGINLLVPRLPILALLPPIAVGLILLQVFAKYQTINRIFKWLCLALLAYVATAFVSHANLADVAKGTLIPKLPRTKDDISLMIAILGTTISPYLFFWQAGQEIEEQKAEGKTTVAERQGATRKEIANRKLDVSLGMLASNLVMYFIILTTAATLHVKGKTDISSATDAASALQPLLGSYAKILFAIGIIGAGLLAIPVLTGSTGYTASEAFGWRHGLDEKVTRAKGFYGLIIASTLAGMLFNYFGLDPIKALVYSAVINGVTSPPLLLLVVMLANRHAVMGKYTNRLWSNIFGWAAVALMTIATIAYFVTLFI